jgi:hypothetical protein
MFQIKKYPGAKSYAYKAELELIKKNNLDLNKDDKAHEWLTHDLIIKPFYDIDEYFQNEEEFKINKLKLKRKWMKILKDTFPNGNIAISDCSRYKQDHEISKKNKGKGNYFVGMHFVVNNYKIKMKELEDYNIKIELDKIEGYDSTVYSDGRNFRLIGQSKCGSNVKMKPINNKDDLYKFVIQDVQEDDELIIHTISPPVSPVSSDDENIVKKKVIKKNVFKKNDDYNYNEIENLLKRITTKYDYKDWIKVGFCIFNITNGDENGLKLFNEWSKIDIENYNEDFIKNEWKYLNKKIDNNEKMKLGLGSLIFWAEADNPDNIYKKIYLNNVKLDQDGKPIGNVKPNIIGVVNELNKCLIYVKSTSQYIKLDVDSKGNEQWFLYNHKQTNEALEKYTFYCPFTKKEKNPFTIWKKHKNRREVLKIDFDPENKNNPDIFNLWKGFSVSFEDCEKSNIEDCQLLLDHILKIWCKGDKKIFNYVIKYFARIIQKPHIKSGVILCLKSKQGAGKGVIFKILEKIIGDNHYCQIANANNIFGDFNGLLEAKILVDLDEAFWGGDKKLEGQIKSLVTEKKQYINKKNINAYSIDDYANFIITTNNDRFASASSPEDRRHYCLELDNKYAGRATEETKKYFKPLYEAEDDDNIIKAFAKYLYTLDIEEYNPRHFEKTALLQDQIEQSWGSHQKWWFQVLKNGGFECDESHNNFCIYNENQVDKDGKLICGLDKITYETNPNRSKKLDQNKKPIIKSKELYYYKDFIYENYEDSCSGFNRKMDRNEFFKKFKEDCLDDLYKEVQPRTNGERLRLIKLPDIKEARKKYNELQSYEYDYEDYEIMDDDGCEWEWGYNYDDNKNNNINNDLDI